MSSNDLQERVGQLENRVETLESLFSGRVLDKEHAHNKAKQRNARDKLNVGERYRVFIQDLEAGNGQYPRQGIGTIQGIVTFVEPGEIDLKQGETVDAKVTDVKKSAAEAYAVKKVS